MFFFSNSNVVFEANFVVILKETQLLTILSAGIHGTGTICWEPATCGYLPGATAHQHNVPVVLWWRTGGRFCGKTL